jgi:hypothetical protein
VNAGAQEGSPVLASLAASDNSINSFLFLFFFNLNNLGAFVCTDASLKFAGGVLLH